jgi:hypothetical protein
MQGENVTLNRLGHLWLAFRLITLCESGGELNAARSRSSMWDDGFPSAAV